MKNLLWRVTLSSKCWCALGDIPKEQIHQAFVWKWFYSKYSPGNGNQEGKRSGEGVKSSEVTWMAALAQSHRGASKMGQVRPQIVSLRGQGGCSASHWLRNTNRPVSLSPSHWLRDTHQSLPGKRVKTQEVNPSTKRWRCWLTGVKTHWELVCIKVLKGSKGMCKKHW